MSRNEKDEVNKVDNAIELAVRYGGIDGSHHKNWVFRCRAGCG